MHLETHPLFFNLRSTKLHHHDVWKRTCPFILVLEMPIYALKKNEKKNRYLSCINTIVTIHSTISVTQIMKRSIEPIQACKWTHPQNNWYILSSLKKHEIWQTGIFATTSINPFDHIVASIQSPLSVSFLLSALKRLYATKMHVQTAKIIREQNSQHNMCKLKRFAVLT